MVKSKALIASHWARDELFHLTNAISDFDIFGDGGAKKDKDKERYM
jgi:hypothetical protein